MLALNTAYGVVSTLGIPLPRQLPWRHPLMTAAALAVNMVAASTGGYMAASLGVRAPLVSAIALGVAWSGVALIATAVTGATGAPLWYSAAAAVVLVVGTALGGMRRVAASRPVAPDP